MRVRVMARVRVRARVCVGARLGRVPSELGAVRDGGGLPVLRHVLDAANEVELHGRAWVGVGLGLGLG